MPRIVAKLTALRVSRSNTKGNYADGGGLYLQVTANGAKSWIYKFMIGGRAREMGLGPLHTVSLAKAREKAEEYRRQRMMGIDPIEARKQAIARARLEPLGE